MGVGRVGLVVVVVGRHTVHGWVNIRWSLTRTVLGHHSARGRSTLVVASIGAMVIHLTHFRLPRARSHHALVVRPASLVVMVHRGVGLARGSLLGIGVPQTIKSIREEPRVIPE